MKIKKRFGNPTAQVKSEAETVLVLNFDAALSAVGAHIRASTKVFEDKR